ncbi:hypothetical protein CHH58_08165 [Terribacillus saccharophilus]|uniref:hypothetical protein n=1 Tax=Terribacillus saccharophilus TaxID=361277 RepID=UPI000BA5D211|nr:hypothetical protein [Terribacillus saccharophilus]PAF36822.1 hypothetical protein CHH58_08165 [Terribacillus saccharophilus]
MDVKYRSSQWDKTKDSLRNLIGLGVWGKGMIDTMKDITDNLDEASEKVAKYDSDGVVSFSYTSDKDKYQRLFEDFKVLEDFSGNVGDIVEDTIDQPFYEDIDAFVQKVRDSSISNYTTSNHIGATETIPISYYGSYQEYETEKTEINIDDILSGDNYYADQIKASFEEWKVQNPDEDISYEDYRTAAVNTRAFEYESIEDGQFTKEFWVNIAALVVIVGVTVVCPPAGAVLGAAYATVEMGSAISGQDWASGRELDTSERWTRGLLAPLDVLPIGNAVTSFAGTTRTTSKVIDFGGLLNKTKLSSSLTDNIASQTSQVMRLVETAGQQTSTRLRSAAHTVTNTTNILKNKLGEEAVRIAQMGDAGITRVLNVFPQVGAVTDNGVMFASPGKFNKLEESTVKVVNSLGLSSKGTNSDLLTSSGRFIDQSLESNYAIYLARKAKEGKPPRDRLEWKEARDYWLNDSPMARGNKFNKTVRSRDIYDYHEIHLENGKRLDSYDPFAEEIISRKATDLDTIDEKTYREYLKEMNTKYSAGTKIRSNAYPDLDGRQLEGKLILEIPATNKNIVDIERYEQIAKEYGIELRYMEE